MRVFVLGSTGMLGHAVHRELQLANIDTVTTARANADIAFDCLTDSVAHKLAHVDDGDYIVNCIGLITQKFSALNLDDRRRAIHINARFPHDLANHAERIGARVIQIATDCVFSGSTGRYNESSAHDAPDVYGKSKSLGEVPSPSFMHLRTSIIGRERNSAHSLLEWVLHHLPGSTLTGYTDRWWNGITTNAFGRVVAGIVNSDRFRPGTFHLAPNDAVSKASLVQMIADEFDRKDLIINEAPSGEFKDLTLTSQFPDLTEEMWHAAGYHSRPTIGILLSELATSGH